MVRVGQIDDLRLYVPDGNGDFHMRVMGDRLPFKQRDVQLKGSGLTPFSRTADGRAANHALAATTFNPPSGAPPTTNIPPKPTTPIETATGTPSGCPA